MDSLIITEMIQRLVLGDIVVAGLTLPNANVYYEIGVRHAARRTGCVLSAADWARPVFDLAQMRQVRFPLADGEITDSTAITARAHLADGLRRLIAGVSPVFDSLPDYPQETDQARLSAFADLAEELMSFDADVREAYLAPAADRRELALGVLARYGQKPASAGRTRCCCPACCATWWAGTRCSTTSRPCRRNSPGTCGLWSLNAWRIAKTGAAIKAVARLEALIANGCGRRCRG